ncbi:MSHA biogenesis protein MshN, partial [Vibrio lentus]|nr:MSHA biogenesis protein MshN [Vibrio lentus]
SAESTVTANNVQVKPTTTSSTSKARTLDVTPKPLSTAKASNADIPKPIYVASVAKKDPAPISNEKESSGSSANSEMLIEQVELTPEQLSVNAQGRAQKALDANDLTGALKGYTEALRYTPRNEDVRQKLAIL